jgi:hypothetical protein
MTKEYFPELGQMAFGQPTHHLEVPDYIHATLMMISKQLSIYLWNKHQEETDPFEDAEFKNDVFQCERYSWGDEEQPFNFKWKDWELSWYKHFGRGMSMNRVMTPGEAAAMLEECLNSLKETHD